MLVSEAVDPNSASGVDQIEAELPTAETPIEILPAESEQGALLDWLDDGLRGGRRGRLLGEYGPALADGRAEHVVARRGAQPIAHALLRRIRARAAEVELELGMIGLVYTAPGSRGRGLAGRCVEAAAARLAERGAALAALWSDRHAFYGRLGFHPAGLERQYDLGPELCARAARGFGVPGPVSAPGPDDWPALERLYAAKPSRAVRAPGYLRGLASGPDCRVRVCRRAGTPVAYAALGRGDDFAGFVHEWAGEAAAVLACLSELCAGRPGLTWLTGPVDEPPAPQLRSAGANFRDGCFALVRVLDAVAIARAEARAGRPWPVFVWGFDSI